VRILLTGYADLSAVVESVNTGEIFRFIEKPWNNERLKKTIEAAAQISLKQTGSVNIENLQSSSEQPSAKVHHFMGHQHNVFCASCLTEALSIMEEQDIAILITDTMVKGEEMSSLIHVLKETYPLTVVVVLTTQADAHLVVRLVNEGQIFRYLPHSNAMPNFVMSLHNWLVNSILKNHLKTRLSQKEKWLCLKVN